MALKKAPYIFNAKVVSAYDGDTLTAMVDHGMALFSFRSVRILGINCRELKDPGGKEARDHLLSLVPVDAPVIITSSSWDKYGGRIDGRLQAEFGDVSDRMIQDGYAAAWNGVGTRPVPEWPIPGGTT